MTLRLCTLRGLIGILLLPGFLAKFLLLQAGLGMENAWDHVAIVVVLIATVIETAYFCVPYFSHKIWDGLLHKSMILKVI